MDSMIEKVAAAILNAHHSPQSITFAETLARIDPDAIHLHKGLGEMLARAAIEAMKKPTEAMENAAITYGDSPILLTYEAMIDAALGEPAKSDPGIPIYATTEGPKETFQGKRKG